MAKNGRPTRGTCPLGAARGFDCVIPVGHAGTCQPYRPAAARPGGPEVIERATIGGPVETVVRHQAPRPRMRPRIEAPVLPVLLPENTAGELPGQIAALDALFQV